MVFVLSLCDLANAVVEKVLGLARVQKTSVWLPANRLGRGSVSLQL
jgi:hypothetical protein